MIDFLHLPFDPADQPRPTDVSNIPRCSYDQMPADATPSQAWEYNEAFFRTKNTKLIERHIYGRSISILLTFIFDKENLNKLLIESSCLADLFPKKLYWVKRFSNFFMELDQPELDRRVEIWRNLHITSYEESGEPICELDWAGGYDFVSAYYLKSAMAPIDELILYPRNLGGFGLHDDKNPYISSENYLKVKKFLSGLEPLKQRIWDAERHGDSIAAVEYMAELIDKCRGFQPTCYWVSDFQIPYWYDRITANLSKLKRWDEGYNRLEELNGMPPIFLMRTSRSLQETLTTRYLMFAKR